MISTQGPGPEITAERARSLALEAQFAPGERAGAAEVFHRLGVLQLDPLRRVDRAHRLTLLSRLPSSAGIHTVDSALWPGPAVTFELLNGVACVYPLAHWPLFAPIRARLAARPNAPEAAEAAEILALVAEHPAGVTIGVLEHEGRRTAGWEWSRRKWVAEFLVRTGALVVTHRIEGQRVFDLPERRIPAELLHAELSPEATLASLGGLGIASLGIATARDLARHYGLSRAEAVRALELSAAVPVRVAGWADPAWVSPAAAERLAAPAAALPSRLIGPFDSLLRDRDRARRVFSFDYLFEAYKPAETRVYGHYVLGVLHGGRFVGRVDAQRTGGELLLRGEFPEAGIPARSFAAGVDRASRTLARQLRVAPARGPASPAA